MTHLCKGISNAIIEVSRKQKLLFSPPKCALHYLIKLGKKFNYNNIQMSRPSRKLNHIDSDQSESSYHQILRDGTQLPQNRRPDRIKKSPAAQKYLEDIEQEEQSAGDEEFEFYSGGKLVKIFDERLRSGTSQLEGLYKFEGKSYLHLEWLTEEDIKSRNIQLPKHLLWKNVKNQQKIKEAREKFGEQSYFDPSFTEVDKILTTAVIFPNMHHKKSSEMNGKWSEMMMLVCSKILNFSKNHIPYGIVMKDEQYFVENSANSLKLQNVINRVFLDRYASAEGFWGDVGISFENLAILLKGTDLEFYGIVLKECVVFLYWQWYCLSEERYQQYLQNGLFSQKSKLNVNFHLKSNEKFSFEKFVSKNIFLRQNQGQASGQEKQFLLLNPGSFSYSWMKDAHEVDYMNFCFTQLEEADFESLNLNEEVQKLYLVKWRELDYREITWQKHTDLNCPQKIDSFNQFCKIPPKKNREKMEINLKCHKALVDHLNKSKKQVDAELLKKYRRNLYCYHRSSSQKPTQFSAEDAPVYKGYRMLKNFQLEGLNWLIKSWHENRNCLLADEMGLGKTIQTIAFLNHLFVFENVIGPFLIIAPVSTLVQWKNEIEQWSDLNCVIYKGNPDSLGLIQQYEFYHKFVTNDGFFVNYKKFPRFQILLTSYDVITQNLAVLQSIPFQHIVVDQAQKLKNRNCRLKQSLKQLPCSRYLLLTGTPVQNNISEAWALLNVIEPTKFNSFEYFAKTYGKLNNAADLQLFKSLLKPYVMRRVKSEVETSIPKLSQIIITLELTKIQKTFYKGIIEQNKNQLLASLNSCVINNVSINLRKCCNHPYSLSEEVEDQIIQAGEKDQQKIHKLISSSSKMIFVHKFIQKCKANKTKTLIFTQFLSMVDLLKIYCEETNVPYQFLIGSTKFQERQKSIDRFNSNSDVLVFILSTKAGGIGINLTSATNVIIYDSDWNPQNDIQAIARAHRIGQRSSVSVYRLITNQTYEQIIYKSSVKKLGLGIALLDDEYFSNKQEVKYKKSKQEVEKLLRDGVLGFLKNNENQGTQKNLENFSIEEIIENNRQSVNYNTRDCCFSTSKFDIEEKDDDLKISDPNFWEVALSHIESPLQKLVKKVNTQESLLEISRDQQKQTELMIEANEIFFTFIKNKISMTHFNAQEERELKIFLEKISYCRQFHRQYKRIVNEWLEEIEKPSRRFQKLSSEEIRNVVNTRQSTVVQKRRIRIKQQHTNEDQANQIKLPSEQAGSSIDQVNNGKAVEQASSSPIMQKEPDLPINQMEKLNEKKQKRVVLPRQREKQGNVKEELQKQSENTSLRDQIQHKITDFLQSLCFYCEKKRCTLLCKGPCKRLFHKICYENHKLGKKISVDEKDLSEKPEMEQDDFVDALATNFECFQCLLKEAQCFLCNRSGDFGPWQQNLMPNEKKEKEKNKKSEVTNSIDQIFSLATEEEKKNVYECRMPQCHKFFHLKCLQATKSDLTFEISKAKQGEQYSLKCPQHFCSLCRKAKPTCPKISCVRCPVSYHQKCGKLKSESLFMLDNCKFICKIHLRKEELEAKLKEKKEEILPEEQKKQKMAKKKAGKKNQQQFQRPFNQIKLGELDKKIYAAFNSACCSKVNENLMP